MNMLFLNLRDLFVIISFYIFVLWYYNTHNIIVYWILLISVKIENLPIIRTYLYVSIIYNIYHLTTTILYHYNLIDTCGIQDGEKRFSTIVWIVFRERSILVLWLNSPNGIFEFAVLCYCIPFILLEFHPYICGEKMLFLNYMTKTCIMGFAIIIFIFQEVCIMYIHPINVVYCNSSKDQKRKKVVYSE